MQAQPPTILLVEPQDKKLWRVVSRATTLRGISPYHYEVLAEDIPTYPAARKVFENIKPTNKGDKYDCI